MQDHREAIIACSVAAKVEVAGHDMYVVLMLVRVCIENILIPQRERPLGIVEAYDPIPVAAERRSPDAIQIQQQHASIQSELTIIRQAATVSCNAFTLRSSRPDWVRSC